MAKAAPQIPDLFDDALSPAPAPPLAGAPAEPRPARPAPTPPSAPKGDYTAADIQVLEGLEPVRMRPGMYIGGTDERALHHLFAEVLDNAMDEAVAGHAKLIEVRLEADGALSVRDDGRGMPVDPHPKFPDKSALEVILTTLHSGGKFKPGVYQTSGGLHGVGVSVVNALSERLDMTVWRDGAEWRQAFSQGKPLGPIEQAGPSRKRGTLVRFTPDPEIFGANAAFRPSRLYRMARSKAYLFRGVEIRWTCAAERIHDETPAQATFHFPNGLADFLRERVGEIETVTPEPFAGRIERASEGGAVEWAVAWTPAGFGEHDGFMQSYCNTVPTPEGGTHEAGFRAALTRGLKAYAELAGEKRAGMKDDFVCAGAQRRFDDRVVQRAALSQTADRDAFRRGRQTKHLHPHADGGFAARDIHHMQRQPGHDDCSCSKISRRHARPPT